MGLDYKENTNDKIYLITGLGNPGDEYNLTRHNAGFIFLDYLRERLNFASFETEKKFISQITSGNLEEKKLILLKPQTYMNHSGDAVSSVKSYYKITIENIWVIHDDLDLDFGKYKIQPIRGPRQHNGILSIEKSLGTESFNKIRIGIENRGELRKNISGKDYVLSTFTKVESNLLYAKLFDSIYKDLVERLLVNI